MVRSLADYSGGPAPGFHRLPYSPPPSILGRGHLSSGPKITERARKLKGRRARKKALNGDDVLSKRDDFRMRKPSPIILLPLWEKVARRAG